MPTFPQPPPPPWFGPDRPPSARCTKKRRTSQSGSVFYTPKPLRRATARLSGPRYGLFVNFRGKEPKDSLAWTSRGSSADESCPPTRLKSTLSLPCQVVTTTHLRRVSLLIVSPTRPPLKRQGMAREGRGGSRVGGRTIFVRPLVGGWGVEESRCTLALPCPQDQWAQANRYY